jgi:hypothetical protein
VNRRSVPKQIKCWARIGKIADENPDLPYSVIKAVLLSKQEAEDGKLSEYQFGSPAVRAAETPSFRQGVKRLHGNQKRNWMKPLRPIWPVR